MTSTLLALLTAGGLSICPESPSGVEVAGVAPAELEALYRGGRTFSEFLATADRRRGMWEDHYREGRVEPALLRRASEIPGTWRLLVIAEDWCSDSVNTIPFLALLTEQVEGIEMRVIDSDAGRELMESHRTPDGRPATPTVLILDRAYDEVGCWVERPSDLQSWALESRPGLTDREFLTRKMAWYAEDAGGSTVREIVELIARAAAGEPACGADA